jgi:Holliday junction resolvase RusA-like endonuclease
MNSTITLYGQLYSKKNSKRVFRNKGRTIVLSSKAYEKSKPDFLWQLKDNKNKEIWQKILEKSSHENDKRNEIPTNKKALMLTSGLDIPIASPYPLYLNIKIYRKTKRQFDYNNIIQGLQDIMVEAGYLPDDSAMYLIPHFQPYEVDPKNPRVLLTVL